LNLIEETEEENHYYSTCGPNNLKQGHSKDKPSSFSADPVTISVEDKENNLNQSFIIGHQSKASRLSRDKDTLTASSQLLSDRTLNLKKEITSLDEEIFLLQKNLQSAMNQRKSTSNYR